MLFTYLFRQLRLVILTTIILMMLPETGFAVDEESQTKESSSAENPSNSDQEPSDDGIEDLSIPSAEEDEIDLNECIPPCRAGFSCIEGKCLSPCNPICYAGEVCIESGQCVPAKPPQPPRPEPKQTSGWAPTIPTQSPQAEESGADKPHPWWAVTINPMDMVVTTLVYKYFPLGFNVMFSGRYVGATIYPLFLIADGGLVAGGAIAYARIQPLGRGLGGLYIQPGIGGFSVPALAVAGEIGWTWFVKHFVISVGGGILYLHSEHMDAVSFFPNMSIGFGG